MPFVVLPPSAINSTAEFDVFPNASLTDCIMIEVLNDTTYAFNLILPGSQQSYMAPQTAKFFGGTDWYGDTIKIFPLSVLGGTFTGIPQKITILGYKKGENVPPDGTTIDLSKTVYIGNTVTTTGTMNELQNDNNPAGSAILETTVTGQVTSNQTATNDGIWTLGVIISNAIVKFFQTQKVDPIVMLGALSHSVEVLGSLITDQNLTVKGTTSLDNGSITTNGSGTITAGTIGSAVPLSSLGVLPGTSGFSTRFGAGLHGTTDVGVECSTYLIMGGQQGFLFKQNNWYDGTNHYFITANPAYQYDLGGGVSGIVGQISTRSNSNTPSAGAVITWNAWVLVNANNATTATTATTATSATSATTATNVSSGGTINAASATLTGAGTALTVNNNATVTGNLTVTGTSSLDAASITTNGSGTINTSGIFNSTSGTSTLRSNGTDVVNAAGQDTYLNSRGSANLVHIQNAGTDDATFGSGASHITRGNFAVDAGTLTVSGDTTINGTNDAISCPNGAISIGGRTVNFNANTSGNGVLYQVMDGAGFKITYIHVNAFTNTGAANVDVAFPIAYVEGAEFFTSNIGQIQCMASGVAQSFQVITALAAAGGTTAAQTTLNQYSWAHVGGTPFDTIRFSGSIAGSHSGVITILGR